MLGTVLKVQKVTNLFEIFRINLKKIHRKNTEVIFQKD